MIKAVVFDVGGVLALGSMTAFYERGCEYLGVPKMFNFDVSPHIHLEYNRGKITPREAFDGMFQKKLTDNEFKTISQMWRTTFARYDAMIELAEDLKRSGYRIAVLSNSDQIVSDHLEASGLYDPFEFQILSHKLGFIKPEPEIYDALLNKLNLKPEEVIFIDDNNLCVEGAIKAGIKTIRYDNMDTLICELRALGVRFDAKKMQKCKINP